MRILMVGDIVGRVGLRMVTDHLAAVRQKESLDFVIANAENVEDGSGLRKASYRKLIDAGVDFVTLGDHIYRKKEIIEVLDSETNIVKPANYPPDAPGREWAVATATNGEQVAVFSLQGRIFMKPCDCPFLAADRVLKEIPDSVKVRFLDLHAEATSDMQLMGRYLDGRVTAVLGTHTHVPTADEQILPKGTAFQCDVGMTGPYESILGRMIEPVTITTVTMRPKTFSVAVGDVRISGAIVDVDPKTGSAKAIKRLQINEEDARLLGNE